jgi:hypothetical protein
MVAPAAACACAVQFSGSKMDQEVDSVYDDGHGSRLELLGVCSITPDKVDCWDRDGRRSAALSKTVEVAGRSQNCDLGFFYGRKTRYAIFRGSPGMNPSFQRDNGSSSSAFWGAAEQDRLLGAAIVADKNDETAGLTASLYLNQLSADLPLKVGATAQIGDVSLAIAVIKNGGRPAGPAPQNGYQGGKPEPGRRWTVILTSNQDVQSWNYEAYAALDKNRQPIRYVDLNGRVLTGAQFIAMGGDPNPPFGLPQSTAQTKRKPRCTSGHVVFVAKVAGAEELSMNIDPAEVAYLQVSDQAQTRIRFRNIPLEPKE